MRAFNWLVHAALFGLLSSASAARAADVASCVEAHEAAQRGLRDGQLLAARRASLVCAQRECPALLQQECGELYASVERSLPSIILAVTDPSGADLSAVAVQLDDKRIADQIDGRPVSLDPGAYKLRFEAPGYAPYQTDLVVRTSEQLRIVRARLTPLAAAATHSASADEPPAPGSSTRSAQRDAGERSPRRRALFAVGATTVALAAVSIGFGLRGLLQKNDCEGHCSNDQADTIRRNLILGDVTGPLAGVAASAWVGLLVRERRQHGARVGVSLVPARARTMGAALVVQGQF